MWEQEQQHLDVARVLLDDLAGMRDGRRVVQQVAAAERHVQLAGQLARGPPGSPAQHQRQARPHWCSLPAPRRSPSGTSLCRTPSICSLAIMDKVRVIQVLRILGHPNVQNIIHVRYLQHFRKSKHGLYECSFRFRDSPCFYPLLFIRVFP